MQRFDQPLNDPNFVQNPYPAYDRAREMGDIVDWPDFGMPAAMSHKAVSSILKDRRFGREAPTPPEVAQHTNDFYAVEAHSMLELEPPRHTRLRSLVLRAFTSRRINALEPEVLALCDELIDDFPSEPFDLLTQFAQPLPVRIIARLLGVPEDMAPQLLSWSNQMVAMYQTSRTHEVEVAANTAAREFSEFMRGYVEERRATPADDLITHLIRAEEDGERLSTDELITTCILLLNAGHEATVHTMGNGVKALLEEGQSTITPAVVEEIMRYDPPLHIFTRWAYDDIEVCGHVIPKHSQIACVLGAANRDPAVYEAPNTFKPDRGGPTHTAFGAGLHFCVGAPLARLELTAGLTALLTRCPDLRLTEQPLYGDTYHFHGLARLMVQT
ncbi:cytochrome P450 [Shimia ponticola]|uniref:cytochrome P450 n=1 Tax=Shimia ponticola TaxID=2582893 RepID=UPI0011BE79F2|nr:cytochrome P450 [Shimia ponticola]